MKGSVEVSDREIADAVAAVEDETLELLAELVEAPTTLGNEDAGQEIVERAYRDLLELEPVDIAMDAEALRAHPLASPFSWDVSEKRNVVADWHAVGTGGRSLVLNGHVDVVGPASEKLWRTPPFRAVRDGDWLYGRGSGDMKAGLAAIVGAVLGLRRLGLGPLAPVQLQSVVEEECGGNGALQCVLSGGLRPDAAVIPEPFPGLIPTSQVGVLWFHVDVAGTAAHVADAQDGFNAIDGGGWCGNDVFGSALGDRARSQAREYTRRMGDRLHEEGYRGYCELDVLADVDSGDMYLGELNPRVTGASSMTNVTAVAYGDMPLFLFHLLEFADVDYEVDVAALNEAWAHPGAVDEWSQFILKQTEQEVELIVRAPRSGVWRFDSSAPGGIRFVRRETDWHDVAGEDEAFYLRIAAEGQYRYPGADLGILVTRGRLQTDEHELTERARHWISGIKSQFEGAPAPVEAELPPPEPFSFKML